MLFKTLDSYDDLGLQLHNKLSLNFETFTFKQIVELPKLPPPFHSIDDYVKYSFPS